LSPFAFHLPVLTVALCSDLQNRTEFAVLERRQASPSATEATSWTTYVRKYTRQHQLPGDFAILINGPGAGDLESNHRMEIVDL